MHVYTFYPYILPMFIIQICLEHNNYVFVTFRYVVVARTPHHSRTE